MYKGFIMKKNGNSNQSIRLKNILLLLNICFGVILFYVAGVIGRINTDYMMVGSLELPSQSVKGVITACVSLSCVLIVCLDYKIGIWTGVIFIGVSIVRMALSCIMTKSIGALPGIISSTVSLLIIFIISYELRRIYKDSITDITTGLLNRRGFNEVCEKKIYSKKKFHVLCIKLQNVRSIADVMGHEYVDLVFCEISKRIKNVVDKKGAVAKLDGKEFAVLIRDDMDPEEVSANIIASIAKKIVVTKNETEYECYIPAYIGVASFPDAAKDTESLLRYAGIAALSAMDSTTAPVMEFDKKMEDNLNNNIEVEKLVKDALVNDYFYLEYQPQFDIKTKELRGFESLIRLKKPDGTIVSPGLFIPVSENSDLILKIDEFVLNKALSSFKDHIMKDGRQHVLSINVSAKNMASPDFVDKVLDAIYKNDFPASCLEIEITEYSFSFSMDQTIANVKALRENGIMVALDDFGTGYTSLSQLLHLPINLLKIDKSLVDDIETNQTNMDFVDAVMYMGHLMGCEIISEGVEKEGQLEILKEHECDFVQGFIWSKPISFDNAVALIENN